MKDVKDTKDLKGKKNLVFIFTDQQRYDTLNVYGNKKIKVPNLNKLAQKSAVFMNSYVTQPVCTPSRGSLLTGLYPHNHGCETNNRVLSDDIPTLAEMIDRSAYTTGYVGKWHLGNEVMPQHGFDTWISVEDYFYRNYYEKKEYENVNSSYHEFLVKNGFIPDIEDEDYYAFSREFVTRIPAEFSKPAFVGGEAVKFIEENKEKPFILYANFLEPHNPYHSAYDNMYNPEEIELPETFNTEPDECSPLKYHFNRRFYREVDEHAYPLSNERKWRNTIARYYGAISLVDKYVGRIMDAIEKNGLDENTIIVFTSDHGDMMGEFKMLAKSVMYEGAVKVPLLIKVPGITDEQRIIKTPVSQIDVVPTLLELLGVYADIKTDGKSLLSVIKGEKGPELEDVMIEWNGNVSDMWLKPFHDEISGNDELKKAAKDTNESAGRTIRTPDGWKMSLSEAGENELYDLNKDPHETKNLYFNDEYKSIVDMLSDKIYVWQDKHKDSMCVLR